jgi:glycosyltransferase involved in cell wall biosynthesis
LKIALITFEYPPETSQGGIATYFHQIANIMHSRGHYVEVFAGGWGETRRECEGGVIVHRLKSHETRDLDVAYKSFHQSLGSYFLSRHNDVHFDVIEGPELEAEAREVVRHVPNIPLVIKIHSPSILLWRFSQLYPNTPKLRDRIIWMIRSRLYGYPIFWNNSKKELEKPDLILHKDRIEREHLRDADDIIAPSKEIVSRLVPEWLTDQVGISIVNNPYIPSQGLLSIPIDTMTNVVTFIGRLQVLKGVIELSLAIPLILKRHPNVKFRFVGDTSSCSLGDLRSYLKNFLLRNYAHAVEFIDFVEYGNISEVYSSTDVCVFPSLWDNFPNVCLEAMAAGRGVVGTDSGGMATMIVSDEVGRLVSPGNPQKIADAVIDFLSEPEKRMRIGRAARQRVLKEFSADRIGIMQEDSYIRAIKRRQEIGSR